MAAIRAILGVGGGGMLPHKIFNLCPEIDVGAI